MRVGLYRSWYLELLRADDLVVHPMAINHMVDYRRLLLKVTLVMFETNQLLKDFVGALSFPTDWCIEGFIADCRSKLLVKIDDQLI